MREKKHIVLSLTDSVRAIKQGRLFLYVGGILCGCLAFFYLILQPISFTAHGIFNGHSPDSTPSLLKAFEFLGKEDALLSSVADQRSLLHSPPVLENVVRVLDLQGTLTEKKIGGSLKEIWYTLKTAKAYRDLKKQRIPSRVLNATVLTSCQQIIPDKEPPIVCSGIDFSSETALSLKIHFIDASTFQVLEGKRELGIGRLGSPFIWSGGSFTLSGEGKKKQVLGLHLIPLEAAVESLQHSLRIKKNRENSALIDISYTHRDRRLAAAIINTVMEQYQIYLMNEGKNKIQRQLVYLQQRQEETMTQLDHMLEKQKESLESDLSLGIIITLEKELMYMAAQQAEKREELLRIGSEMTYLSHILYQFHLPIEDLLMRIHSTRECATLQVVTIEGARMIIDQYQHQLDQISLDHEKYEYCLTKLFETDFDSSSLVKILNDGSLHAHFEKMHHFHHCLMDEKNWTEKERQQLKEELELEKRFLIQYIQHLKEGGILHAKILQERMVALRENLLYLLFDRYQQIKNTLQDLTVQAAHFPQKWLNEQKIAIHTELYTDMMEAVTKMIEAKNIGCNINYLMSNILQKSIPPILPNHPHLIKGVLLGCVAGVMITILGICFYQVWLGPSASFENLSASGFTVIPKEQKIQHLGLAISKGGKNVLLLSRQQDLDIHLPLIAWLERRGERVLVLNLSVEPLPAFIDIHNKEASLASDHFAKTLATLKEQYDRLILISQGSPTSCESKILMAYSDTIVYGISYERIADLEQLPENTLFCMQNRARKMVSLKTIQPLLTDFLKHSSFSLSKNVWERFPLKKT